MNTLIGILVFGGLFLVLYLVNPRREQEAKEAALKKTFPIAVRYHTKLKGCDDWAINRDCAIALDSKSNKFYLAIKDVTSEEIHESSKATAENSRKQAISPEQYEIRVLEFDLQKVVLIKWIYSYEYKLEWEDDEYLRIDSMDEFGQIFSVEHTVGWRHDPNSGDFHNVTNKVDKPKIC